jgi:hypothetical protein
VAHRPCTNRDVWASRDGWIARPPDCRHVERADDAAVAHHGPTDRRADRSTRAGAGLSSVAMTSPDWFRWHDPYDDPGSSLHRRLLRVQYRVGQALDSQPHGPIRVLSMCAGQGRDLLEPLATHPRRGDVRALLVERDPRNAALAARTARQAGLDDVEVRIDDASRAGAYASVVPVHIALVCGVFGNIPDEHVRQTICHLPRLLLAGATVIWTRHREPPDLTPRIRAWFAEHGFAESSFDTEPGFLYGVGTHLLTGPAATFHPDLTLFRFDGDGATAAR